MAARKKAAKKAAGKKVVKKVAKKGVAKAAKVKGVKLNDLVVITKGTRKNAIGYVLDISGKQSTVGFADGVVYEGAIRTSSLRAASKAEAGQIKHFATLLESAKKAAFEAGIVKGSQTTSHASHVVESAEETKAINDQITDAVTQVAAEDEVEDTLAVAEDEYNQLAI